jgi:hypothetical protein
VRYSMRLDISVTPSHTSNRAASIATSPKASVRCGSHCHIPSRNACGRHDYLPRRCDTCRLENCVCNAVARRAQEIEICDVCIAHPFLKRTLVVNVQEGSRPDHVCVYSTGRVKTTVIATQTLVLYSASEELVCLPGRSCAHSCPALGGDAFNCRGRQVALDAFPNLRINVTSLCQRKFVLYSDPSVWSTYRLDLQIGDCSTFRIIQRS